MAVSVLVSNAYASHGPVQLVTDLLRFLVKLLRKEVLSWKLHNFENVSREEVESEAVKSAEFDALRDAYVTNLSMAYGIAEDFHVNAQVGWYSGRRF